MFTPIYQCVPLFSCVCLPAMFTRVCLCLLVSLCLVVFTCLFLFTYVDHCLLVCFVIFTHATRVYICLHFLPMLTRLPMFT